MTRTILVVATILIASLALGVRADTAPVKTIVGNVVYENGTYTFRDPILIPKGSSLTFRNANVWLDIPDYCTLTCTPQIENHGTLRFENAVVDTTIYASTDGYRIDSIGGGALYASGSTFARYNIFNVYDTGSAFLSGNTYTAGGQPLKASINIIGYIRDNVVTNSIRGFAVTESNMEISGNTLSGIQLGGAIWVDEGGDGASQAVVRTADVRNNVVSSCSSGIVVMVEGGGNVFHNTVRGCNTGLATWVIASTDQVARWPPSFAENVLDGNARNFQVGASINGNAAPQSVTLNARGNANENATNEAVYVYNILDPMTLTVDWSGSWWGSAAGPAPGSIVIADNAATVPTSPHLTSTPAWRVGR